MAKWKLCRQTYGDDIYELVEGEEITIGRGTQNKIVLSSLNISRKHCVITVKDDEVIIEDLKSANGIFVGLKKIPPNIPFSLSDNDIIGLGWTEGAALAKINDTEKFVFKLLKINQSNIASIIDKIQYQNDNEARVTSSSSVIDRKHYKVENEPHVTSTTSIIDRIQYQSDNEPHVTSSDINLQPPKLTLKRKSNSGSTSHSENNTSDSITKMLPDNESSNNSFVKKFKHSFNYEDAEPIIKMENEDEHYEAFNIKQECFDDEIAIIDSDSDSEQWYIRLSQNSPRKSFSAFNEMRKSEECHTQDSSYSQLDDDVIFVTNENKKEDKLDEEEYVDDLFTTLPQPVNIFNDVCNKDIARTNEDILTSESINACNNTTEKCNPVNYTLPTLNIPMDTLDGTSSNKITNANYVTNKNSENNIIPELTKVCNNSIKQNKEFEQIFPIKSSSIKSAINNKTVEKVDRINALSNASNDPNKTHKEAKKTIICEIETNKLHKSKKVQITDHTSPSHKKYSKNSKGNFKKKNDRKSRSSSKIQITNSQKEERKKKLRDIATKNKEEGEHSGNSNLLKNEECCTTTLKVNAKVTSLNRGAFLIDSKQLEHAPSNKSKIVNDKSTKKDVNDSKDSDIINTTNSIRSNEAKYQSELADKHKERRNNTKKKSIESKLEYNKHRTLSADTTPSVPANALDIAMNRRHSDNTTKESNEKKNCGLVNNDKSENLKSKTDVEKPNSIIGQTKKKQYISVEKSGKNVKTTATNDNTSISNKKETSADIKLHNKDQVSITNPALLTTSKPSIKTILKPMKENKEPNRKSYKRVTFSNSPPEVREFVIEHGNEMKKTCTAKSTLAKHQNIPAFPLQKLALTKILRWNPHWLEEQNNLNEPPPILGHNNVPLAILHSFSSHMQYVDLIGDLLLMEIWECLTQGHIKNRNNNLSYIPMRIESLPLTPPHRQGLELINLNVNVSVPKSEANVLPREGEIMILVFGEEKNLCRFFFVHNVRCLPSPQNNINLFYSISLQTLFTDKIKNLQRGTLLHGRSLAYINKDLRLFEAMENLSRSPLNEVILNPQPQHFILDESDRKCSMDSKWSQSLNDSQRTAVMCAVSAAQGQRPRIHMIQGPPGTGKSRVICAIVMEYFYDAAGKKQRNRGKILICATSNAAVDELVIRLLDIRQSLPQPERLKLIRVGREDAMHARARDISSQRLAQRDVARLQAEPVPPPSALTAEISLLEAKMNMWETKKMSANDDARKAYCQNRVNEIIKRIAMARMGVGGGGAAASPEQLAQAERRVLEGADVVLTTLASAHSHKMRGLAGRIALCVVDEAGQAIEPETLVPLTLGVTRLVLVGDPQQLPGFICSQRAKQHGLGESLFSRLSSCAEMWTEGGPILLDRQYRMHPHIADYPNRAFYDSRVHNEPAHTPPPTLDAAPYFVLGICSGDNGQDASGANNAEAWGAARVALALRSQLRASPTSTHSLAIITPYAAQRDLIRRNLRTLLQAEGSGEEGEVEVNTVDSFQGQERSVVVVSLARSHGLGFLAAAGRMNVMLTRAKHALVLCLNPRALENNYQWRSLVEDAQKRNLFGTLPIQMCRPPSIQPICNQEILRYLSNTSNNVSDPEHSQYKRRPQNQYRRRHQRRRN